VLKRPTGAFGALLGKSASKRKLDADKKVSFSLMKHFKGCPSHIG